MKALILICFTFISLSIFGQKLITANIPKSINYRKAPGTTIDSVLFKMFVKNDSIQLYSTTGLKTITNFEQIDDYYCTVTKIKSSKSNDFVHLDYFILLFIDSTVSFQMVDKIFEEFKTLEHNKIFLCTNSSAKTNNGFYIDFTINPDNRQKIVTSLYGPNFIKFKNLQNKCIIFNTRDEIPPPPPLSTQNPDPLDFYIKMKKQQTDTNYYFIKLENSILTVNNKPCNIDLISEIILKRDSKIFLNPTENNTYNDFIKLIDILHIGQRIAFEKLSLNLYHKKISDMDYDKFEEIVRTHQLYFKFLSLSDQIYLENNFK